MDIGSRIKALREIRGLTLEQVGSYVGVNKATVQRYESGNIDIKRNVAIKLAECLGVSPGYIMGWDEPAPAEPGLDSELVSMLAKLKPGEITRVTDFISGLIAAREES